jgi:hypothetical protein
MAKQMRHWTADDADCIDDPAKLPPDRKVTAEQLTMRPGQTVREKARELQCSLPTLRLWHAEWKGSGYDPDYVIPRAAHGNWLRNMWKARDWPALVRAEVAKGRARHLGDVLFACGLTSSNAQWWGKTHKEFEQALFHSGVSCPPKLWPEYLSFIRHSTIDRYRQLKAELMAEGLDETAAMHAAGDRAVAELRYKTAQRRRVERDTLMGVAGHESLLEKYRKGVRLDDAHSRRIAKKMLKVSRWVSMERGLREAGYDEEDIESMMAELMGAFRESDEAGQAKWQQTRKKVLRRRSEAARNQKAKEVEAQAIKFFTEKRGRGAPLIADWAEWTYADRVE